MLAEQQLSLDIHGRCSFVAEDPIDCPPVDLMSIPLDRLCQLAWPLLQCNDLGNYGRFTTVPSVSETDMDGVCLAEAINEIVVETVRAARLRHRQGPFTCHTLRSALFQRALQSMRVKTAVVQPGQWTDVPSATVRPLAPTHTTAPTSTPTTTGERRGYVCVEPACQKAQRCSAESSTVNDDISTTEAGLCAEKWRGTSVSWVVLYVSGQQGTAWLSEKVQEIVDAAASSHSEAQKQLVSTAASVSVQAQHNKRSAQVFIIILKEVLRHWNTTPDTTGEAGIFGFSVVVPILHITRFTSFNDADAVTVGKLLSTVCVPSTDWGFSEESVSIATFVTKYKLTLEEEASGEHVAAAAAAAAAATTASVEPTLPPLPSPPPPSPPPSTSASVIAMSAAAATAGTSSPPLFFPSRLVSLVGEMSLQQKLRGIEGNAASIKPVMATEVFLVAPLARKVCVHVHRVSSCDGVQLALVPCSSSGHGSDALGCEDSIEPVWFEPREGETYELNGGCSGVLRYRRNPDSPAPFLLEAEVRVETSLQMEGRWVEEFRNALSSAQLEIAAKLLQNVNSSLVSSNVCLREESLLLFQNGLLDQPRVKAPPRFVVDLLNMDDATLRRHVPCRQSDIRGVRAALTLIGTLFGKYEPDHLTWNSRLWRDAIKCVSLASSSFGKNPGATEMVTFILEHLVLSHLTIQQIMDGSFPLLSSNISVSELQATLSTQRAKAKDCVLAFSLLLRAKENFVPGDMFRVVSLLRDVMMYEGGHYLLRFQGCGKSLEEKIRYLVRQLLSELFKALRQVMSLPEGKERKMDVHRFLWDADDFGPFAMLSLSLLATPLDECDIRFIRQDVYALVEGILPDFTNFTRSASFMVNDIDEGCMLGLLRDLLDEDVGNSAGESPIPIMMTGANEHGLGLWVPTGREPVCSTSTPIYCPGSQLSSVYTADVQMVSPPPPELILALASEQLTNVTRITIDEDPEGFYFFPHDGTLHYAHRQVSLLPLSQGDTFTFCFSFSPRTCTGALCLLVNGVQIARFPSPKRKLFFLAYSMKLPSLRSDRFQVSFRYQTRNSAATTRNKNNKATTNTTTIASSVRPKRDDGMHAGSSLPTRHAISMFSTLVFAYLVSSSMCHLSQNHRQKRAVGDSPSGSRINSAACDGNTRTNFNAEEVWKKFVIVFSERLLKNVDNLVKSIKRLPPLQEVQDATERVKRNAASLVYHRFLMDYINIIRTAISYLSSPVSLLSTLTGVLCCEEVTERVRCVALTVSCAVLEEPYQGASFLTYNPLQLWKCCAALSGKISAETYKPMFTPKSTAVELAVVSGGRRIKTHMESTCTSRVVQNTISYAANGIPMDGSLGDVVSFSARLQRGSALDTLGRFYHVGVACPHPLSSERSLTRHPGGRQEIACVYAITDYFTDVTAPLLRTELPRHAKHWMSSEENVIYGSGDVITVTVNTKLRYVSFERNGMSLGILYTNIPSIVKVLFPFVELYNRDASAVWMYPPREIGIRARMVMRAMLSHWKTELVPRLAHMLRKGNVVALGVLGADGDESSFSYRSPPRSELKGSRVVRFVQQMGTKAEIMLEEGMQRITVPAAALEPNYNEVISDKMPVASVADKLMHIVSNSLTFVKDAVGGDTAHIKGTKAFVSALRLLSEMDVESIPTQHAGVQRVLLQQLIHLLAAPDVIPSESAHILLDSWNELMLLPDDDVLCIPIPHVKDLTPSSFAAGDQDDVNADGGCGASGKENPDFFLQCPCCNEEWGSCTDERHESPYTLCVTLHHVLQRLGVSSPFTGFACEWILTEGAIRVTLRVTAPGELEGEGEDRNGVFSFAGKRISSTIVRGRCVYKCVEGTPKGGELAEEWACAVCTFINLSDSTRCAMCTTARPGATWTCGVCGYAFNSNNSVVCTTCGYERVGATEAEQSHGQKQAFCEGCGRQREYTTFHTFECHLFCEHCQQETRWLPEEKNSAVVEAMIVGAGDKMNWVVTFGGTKRVYMALRSVAYSLEEMQQIAETVSPGASDLSQYVPSFAVARECEIEDKDHMPSLSLSASPASSAVSSSAASSSPSSVSSEASDASYQMHRRRDYRAVISAVLFFCSRIVCRWGPDIAPQQLAKSEVLSRLRVLDDSWLVRLREIPTPAARGILHSCLRLLLAGINTEQVICSLSTISRILMNSNTSLLHKRHYLLYALCLNAARGGASREIRVVCYAAINMLLEEACGQPLNARCLADVVVTTPVVAGQLRLMVHASLRSVDVSISANVTLISWLLQAVERMERQQRFSALFDDPSPSIFPYIVELPDTRTGDGGELIVGQVRGSVGVLASKGGQYYFEIVLPSNLNERNKTIIMGWGTMQHEVLGSGQHVGSDIHSWGFNCQDRLHMLTGEQAVSTPHPIVGGDVVGALLDLDAMMMCWSVNGEELMWVAVSTQGKDEAIYPFVSASAEPSGVVVRLGHTQFRPEGYEDFTPLSHEVTRRESVVEPKSYDFYVQLCSLGNEIVNGGFTVDSLVDTTLWIQRAQAVVQQYPLLSVETAEGKRMELLRPYFQHLRSINALAVSVSKNHDIFCDSSYLVNKYQKACQLLFFTARWSIVERQIDRCLSRSNIKRQREVLIDLNRAKMMTESTDGLDFMTRFGASVTGQLFQQTKDAEIYRDAVMFVIRLAGEVADDAGGVTRSVVTMMCDELNYREDDDGRRLEPLLPFFTLTTHSTMVSVVPNIGFYRENPEHRLLFRHFFTWFGKLMGNTTVSGSLMFSLTLPRLVWKFLTFLEYTIEDYYADIDDTVRGALGSDEFFLSDEFLAIPGLDRRGGDRAIEALPVSNSTHSLSVTTSVKSVPDLTSFTISGEEEECIMVERRRKEAECALVHQFDGLLSAMRSGITFVIPAHSLRLIRWDDLQQRVCGTPSATVEDVISSLNLSLISDRLRQMVTDVVQDMTHRQRSQFLLFCSGQRRIPLPEKVQVSCGDDPNAVPTAHTCSPISLLLQPYSSAAVMREKLEVCLRHMYEFGFA